MEQSLLQDRITEAQLYKIPENKFLKLTQSYAPDFHQENAVV